MTTTMCDVVEHLDVRRSADRFVTELAWLRSLHSFSFGAHYDPDNTHHGLLVSHNEDVVRPGGGFDTHRHVAMEVVTWVLDGSLIHRDSTGRTAVVRSGMVSLMSAGAGIEHSERNDEPPTPGRPGRDAHYLQMWVMPDVRSGAPDHVVRDMRAELAGGELVPVASGLPAHRGSTAVQLRTGAAALHVARLPAGGSVELPAARYAHVFLARGAAQLDAQVDGDVGAATLGPGDALRLTDAAATTLTAIDAAEVLVWEMHASLGG